METPDLPLEIPWYEPFAFLSPFAWPTAILAVLLITMAFALVAFVGRRSFYRRNDHGVEGFSSYGNMVLTRLGESLVEVTGRLLLVAGLLSGLVSMLGFMAAR